MIIINESLISLKQALPRWQHCIFEFLIQTEDEYNDFMAYYNKEGYQNGFSSKKLREFTRVYNAMQNYRIDRINKYCITFENFKDIYTDNPYKALTTLFQQGFPDLVYKRSLERIQSGLHTIEKYYDYHIYKPETFFQQIVNSTLDKELMESLRKSNDFNKESYKKNSDISKTEIENYDYISSSNQIIRNASIYRMVRETKLAKMIKILYKGTCQLCRNKIKSSNGYITEAHHIRPYNKTHMGDDSYSNLIVLCPNCHARFDDFYYAIHPETKVVHCLDLLDDQNLKELYIVSGHNLGEEYLNYVWDIFTKKYCKDMLKGKVDLS